jgi:hypothetical protein
MTKATTKYAVVQIYGPVWAIGDSAEAAKKTLMEEAGYAGIQDDDMLDIYDWSDRRNCNDSDPLLVCECTDRLAAQVESEGGDIRFSIDDYGLVDVETT